MEYFVNIFKALCDEPAPMAYNDYNEAVKNALEMPKVFPHWKYIHTIHVTDDKAVVIDLRGE